MLLHSVVNHYNVLFDFSICLSFILFSFSISSCLVCSFLSELQKKNYLESNTECAASEENVVTESVQLFGFLENFT